MVQQPDIWNTGIEECVLRVGWLVGGLTWLAIKNECVVMVTSTLSSVCALHDPVTATFITLCCLIWWQFITKLAKNKNKTI